jgi:REP element-mobilizing transposase RayT
MLRGINQQLIFEEREDYLQFLSLLSKVKEISGFKLYAYCLMGNHLHLLIKENEEPLSQIMRRIGARYVFWFNWKYQRSGHLFQDRFQSKPVESDEYFITVVLYIYQNPVLAGLCKYPKEYEWSSRKSLGKCVLVDEAELSKIISAESIIKTELEKIKGTFLEPTIGRKMAVSDEEALSQMKLLSGANSVMTFQTLDKAQQAQVFGELKKQGVSIRQFARVSGLGKGVVEKMNRRV